MSNEVPRLDAQEIRKYDLKELELEPRNCENIGVLYK